ncbi:MAG: hypothetical protein KGZ83_17100 [Sulfuricella sp.]|nr:hypothetical protein [Sulfuricella sp.]
MQPDFRRKFRAAGMFALAACLALFAMDKALADAKEQLTGRNGVALPLQQVIRNERPRGPVFVAIPIAYVFGLGGDRSPTYCSPTIRADNSSNMPVEELIVGIEYQTKDGRAAGGTVTRYDKIKIGHQDTHYFYQLTVSDCRGLEGKLTVVHCIYSSGADCSGDVQAVGFGTIPLHLSPR